MGWHYKVKGAFAPCTLKKGGGEGRRLKIEGTYPTKITLDKLKKIKILNLAKLNCFILIAKIAERG